MSTTSRYNTTCISSVYAAAYFNELFDSARVYSARLLNEFSMRTSVPDVKGMPECNLNTIEKSCDPWVGALEYRLIRVTIRNGEAE